MSTMRRGIIEFMGFDDLRQKHPEFIYQGFETTLKGDELAVHFNFKIEPDIIFRPEIRFAGVNKKRVTEIDGEEFKNLIFHLGMIELISYWKATCSPRIVIKAGMLNQEQIEWWQKLLINGLGEFFYTNKIDFTQTDLVTFVIDNQLDTFQVSAQTANLRDKDLILVGGGKDSAVTLELLSQSGREFSCLQLNPTRASLDIVKLVKLSGCDKPIVIKRTIDPELLELNAQGYLNGHTPFSAYLAFLGILCAVLYDYKNVVVSNEASASEGNIEYLGKMINHQYAKSKEFEDLFRNYSRKYLCNSVNYFSFLRPFSELQIAQTFSGLEKYHQKFRSCNRGAKTNSWCGDCAKCLFAYIILYPFLGDKVKDILGEDLLNGESLLPLAEQLIRQDDREKPFDCVGMAEESKDALCLCLKRYQDEGIELPVILDKLQNQLNCDYPKIENDLKTHWAENNLSSEYEQMLKEFL